jgi:hypothetical protein
VAQAKEKARRKAIAKQKSLDTEAQGARTRTASVKALMEPAVATRSRPEGSALSLSDLGRTEPVFFPDIERLQRTLDNPTPTSSSIQLAMAEVHAQLDREDADIERVCRLAGERESVWAALLEGLKAKASQLDQRWCEKEGVLAAMEVDRYNGSMDMGLGDDGAGGSRSSEEVVEGLVNLRSASQVE